MSYPALDEVLRGARHMVGPVAMIVIEDDVAIPETLRHHLALGFRTVLALTPDRLSLPAKIAEQVLPVAFRHDTTDEVAHAVAAVSHALGEGWLYWGFNAEFLFYPFCEDRNVAALLAFHAGEQRRSMSALVVDLYERGPLAEPESVPLGSAWMDASGYLVDTPCPEDRQPKILGGLRRRFAEHVPQDARRIDRVPLLRAGRTVRIGSDLRPVGEELATWQCPWHRNVTAAVCSFRAAKALHRNPGSRAAISRLDWPGSVRFDWTSGQLLELGMMEAGQWF